MVGMRWVLLVGGGFVLLAGLALSVRPDHSDHDFAWTIRPPLTAAFLGACYLASCLIALVAASQSTWARARIAVPGVLSFSLLTLAATLLHLGRFHLHAEGIVARGTAWAWLGIYVAVPTAMLVLLPGQLRQPGTDGEVDAPLPAALRGTMAVQATAMIGLGVVMFVLPQRIAWLWPWPLTPLTGRAVGAWLIGLGIAVAQGVWDGDVVRLGVLWPGMTAFGVLQLLALARYPRTLDWSGPRAWVFLAYLVSVLAVGVSGWWLARRWSRAPGQVTASD
jgi:hypothetical protein